MIHQTEAIVLNHHKYGNSSVICNLFTSKYGKINIIAKGARRLKNTHSAVLQPCNNIDLVFFSKKTRKVQTLKEASIITSFISINKDYNKMLYSLTIMDIINKISFHDNPCNIIFRLIKTTLKKFNQTLPENLKLYYVFFQIQLLIYLGYHPSFFQCYQCEQKLNDANFDLDIGQLLCINCSKYKIKTINKDGLNILNFLTTNHIDNIEKKINSKILDEINNLLYLFISFHVPEIRKSKLFISGKTI